MPKTTARRAARPPKGKKEKIQYSVGQIVEVSRRGPLHRLVPPHSGT